VSAPTTGSARTAHTTQVPARLLALHARARAVAEAVLADPPAATGHVPEDTGELLQGLVDHACRTRAPRDAWVLFVAVCGQFPEPTDVVELTGRLELARSSAEVAAHLLHRAAQTRSAPGDAERGLTMAVGTVVIDVDHAARRNRHTGIQRVTREVCTRWSTAHEITLAAWNDEQTALRALTAHEQSRVLDWQGGYNSTPSDLAQSAAAPIVVPWECTVVLPEVAQGMTARTLACLAQYSGNSVVAVGYDAIPVTSADLRPPGEPNMYVRYLNVIKHSRRVAAISSSAAAEFHGFSEAVRAQGLRGPQVTEVTLAAESRPEPAGVTPPVTADRPRVLCVGSHEPHKNHLAVLHAAELCWRDGLDFELVFIGGPGWASPEFDPQLRMLARRGRRVSSLGNVSDDELWSAYRSATCTVFPSVHEGFGLPVAESLACGTPAITTVYGSTGDIAAHGGCLVIDPRDDHAIAAALRTMLSDHATYARLKAEAAGFPTKTWDEYSAELWTTLVGERASGR